MNERLTAALGPAPIAALTDHHNCRVAGIDPRVAPAPPLAEDPELVASTRDGSVAAGRIEEYRFSEDSFEALWGALHRDVLQVRVFGPDPAAAFDEVVDELLGRTYVPTGAEPGAGSEADRSAVLTWPSLDTICANPLVRHGFAPLTSLVLKRLDKATRPVNGPTVRPAQPGDLERLTGQAERLHLFENRLGALPKRPGLRALLANELSDALSEDSSFVLTALIDGVPVGHLHGQFPHGAWIERQVTTAPTGYVSRLFVEPEARRKSVGQALIGVAHVVLRARGAQAVLLHHTLHNPFAAPLWATAGYRPVLTTWTRRPPATPGRART